LFETPSAIREEHEEIMSELRSASKLENGTGLAVRELLKILEPHFQKEERLAMPILGTLSEFASGDQTISLAMVLGATREMRSEYNEMLAEHKQLHPYIEHVKGAAECDENEKVAHLMEGLAHHAKMEEEVLYPAALLATRMAEYLNSSKSVRANASKS
jgi:hypothetical protein